MRGKIGGTAVAFVVTLSMAALSGCSVSFVDALSDSPKANERQRSAGVGGSEGRSHEVEGDSGHSGGTDRGAKEGAGKRSGNNPGELTSGDSGESSDEASSGQGTGNEGAPAGEGARPAGHEGLWFDSEPKDPWDKYVWKSQRFIGKGGDIPKLGPGTADKTFWGLPDLCSKQMQKKMKAVGFEFSKGIDLPDESGCWFQFNGSVSEFIGGGVAKTSYSTEIRGARLENLVKEMSVPAGWSLVKNGSQGGGRCLLVREADSNVRRNNYAQTLVDGTLEGLSLSQECKRSFYIAVIVNNLLSANWEGK